MNDAAQAELEWASLEREHEHGWEPSPGIRQHPGQVLEAGRGWWLVLTEGRRVKARRARSCLVEPRPSDLVIVARLGSGPSATRWILAVLDRPGDDTTLAFEGDVTVKGARHITLAAADGLDLLTRTRVKVASDEVEVVARQADAAVEHASWLGKVITTRVDAIKTVAGFVDRVATRVTERARRVYRTTEEAEYWRAGQIDLKAEEAVTVQSKNTVMTAAQLMKLNGDQIHLG